MGFRVMLSGLGLKVKCYGSGSGDERFRIQGSEIIAMGLLLCGVCLTFVCFGGVGCLGLGLRFTVPSSTRPKPQTLGLGFRV